MIISPFNKAIIITGSMNAKSMDRKLSRKQIIPIQVWIDGLLRPVSFFNHWGELGVSSMAWHPNEEYGLYLTTGNDLHKIDVNKGKSIEYRLSDLRDVHEISLLGDYLWIANSGYDQVVCFDTRREVEIKRIELNSFRSETERGEKVSVDEKEIVKPVDKFHCNQVFEGFDGELYGLVHHVNGKQVFKKLAEKAIKMQGNGGLINLKTGKWHKLNLKGPHSVRKVRQNYWLLDSGNCTINVYDPDWNLLKRIDTGGWGRGAWFYETKNYFYSGISETRRRYLGLLGGRGKKELPNMVQIIDAVNFQKVDHIIIKEGIEQINNIYLVERDVALKLLELENDAGYDI